MKRSRGEAIGIGALVLGVLVGLGNAILAGIHADSFWLMALGYALFFGGFGTYLYWRSRRT